MKTAVSKAVEFIKKETVLTIAFVLAVVSMFFCVPSKKYLDYIDFRVLGILLSLMIIMAALQRIGLFDRIGAVLLRHIKSTRQLCTILVMLCFFSSMIITNDAALITFVPFAVFTLKKADRENKLIFVIVLQTIAANLGSMLTPTGNPQNLYLFNLSDMSFLDFILFMLPYSAVSLFLLITVLMICKRDKLNVKDLLAEDSKKKFTSKDKILTIIYTTLFILGILSVCRILPYYILLVAVIITVFICDKKVFSNVDYCLIFTFICFFVFIGNLGNIDVIKNALEQTVVGKEVFIGIFSSQIISNVPAALMLSGFTDNYKALIIGVNIGGLGTLIASMASLISYKVYAHNYNDSKGKYILWFTLSNLLFLVFLSSMVLLIYP